MMLLGLAAASDAAAYAPEVLEELGRIANRACARDPAERFQTAIELSVAIAEFLRHRASITLSDKAQEQLTHARALRAQDERDGNKFDPRKLRQLEVESRYGFVHALQAWPGNVKAREGLRESLLLALRDELAQGNLGAAESLLLEVDPIPDDLALSLQTLRDDAKARLSRDLHFRELERQGDWRRGAGQRFVFFVAITVASVALRLWADGGHVRHDVTLTPIQLATNMCLAVAATSVSAFVGRRWLMTSRVNTQFVQSILVSGMALSLHRLANCIPAPPTASLVNSEILFCAYGSALGAIILAPWLGPQVPIWIAGALAARIFAPYAGLCFVVSAILAFAVGGWRLTASGKSADEPKP